MKRLKMISKVVGIVVAMMLIATQAFAVVFPTADKNTLVASSGNGVVAVKACGEKDWVLIEFYQDNLRAGAYNNITIKPFKVEGDTMYFQLDKEAIADGQVAFNFRHTGLPRTPWLAIPHCYVKTAGNVAMGNSRPTQDIPESGGAHFVYTGSGIDPLYPIDASKWCEEGCAVSKQSSTGSGVIVSNAPGKVGKEGMAQAIVKSPGAQAVQVKQTGSKAIAKGNNAKAVAITQQSQTVVNVKGATVKHVAGSNNTVNACTYVIVNGVGMQQTGCGACHDEAFYKAFKNNTSKGGKK